MECAPCEVAKKRISEVVEKIKTDIPGIVVKLIDVIENPDILLRYGVLSVPAIALNGKLCFTGIPSEKQLLERIRSMAK